MLKRASTLKSSKGFAMALFIITLLVLGMVSASMAYNAAIETQSTQLSVNKSLAREISVSGIDDFYSHIRADSCFLDIAIELTNVNGNSNSNCLVSSTVTYSLNGSNALYKGLVSSLDFNRNNGVSKWVYLDGGRTNYCDVNNQYKLACYIVTVKPIYLSGSNSRSIGAITKIIVRNGCYNNAQRCIYTSFSQIIKLSQFSDYLFYSDNSTIPQDLYSAVGDPFTYDTTYTQYKADLSCSASLYNCAVAYTYRDNFHGPLYSNATMLLCGNNGSAPNFEKVYTPNTAGNWFVNASTVRGDTACSTLSESDLSNTSQSFSVVANATPVTLPNNTQVTDITNNITGMPNTCILTPSSSTSFIQLEFSVARSGVTKVLASDSSNSPVSQCASNKNIIYVDGSAIITGSGLNKISGAYSLIVAGNLYIGGSIVYDKAYSSGNLLGDTTDIFGITVIGTQKNPVTGVMPSSTVRGDIVFEQTGNDTLIHALLLSVNGGIYTDQWYVDQGPGFSNPTLQIFGSIASKYQAVFGAYNGIGANSDLISGFMKDFTYDSRLLTNTVSQPPYSFTSENTLWNRLNLAEVPAP